MRRESEPVATFDDRPPELTSTLGDMKKPKFLLTIGVVLVMIACSLLWLGSRSWPEAESAPNQGELIEFHRKAQEQPLPVVVDPPFDLFAKVVQETLRVGCTHGNTNVACEFLDERSTVVLIVEDQAGFPVAALEIVPAAQAIPV